MLELKMGECKKKKQLGIICVKVVVQEEIRVLRGVVYMTKSRGLRTEPWGTPQEEVYKDEQLTRFQMT